jgi:flagellar hook-length control protein FliK
LAIVPGSELTLKEDGTWVQPSPVSKPAPALPQGNAPVAVQTPVPQDPAAPLQPVPAQAAAPAPQAPSTAPSLEPQAPATAQAPQSGSPDAPSARTSDGKIPAAQAATVQALQPQAPKVQGPTTESAVRGLEASDRSEGFQAPAQADALQARRNAGDSGFGGLAQFGQDPVKALAQQTARDYAVRESVFRQVSQALREAPGTDNGRMLIRLTPAELGEVHVDLSLVNGKLSARLVASQVEVRDAFVRDLHAFKAGLESQGVSVRDISVAVRAGVADQQPQQPQQQAPQAWWRELPREERTPLLAVAPVAFGAAGGATDQRFSALA